MRRQTSHAGAVAIACPAEAGGPDGCYARRLMEELPESAGPLEHAEHYARMGWPIIPLVGKVPALRRWQLFEATPVNVRFWFGSRRCNLGLRTGESGYV